MDVCYHEPSDGDAGGGRMGRMERGWREELQGRRRWRFPPVSRGFHGNRLSQPVAVVLVTVSRIWQHGEGGSRIHQSNPRRKKKPGKLLQCCSFVHTMVQIEDIQIINA